MPARVPEEATGFARSVAAVLEVYYRFSCSLTSLLIIGECHRVCCIQTSRCHARTRRWPVGNAFRGDLDRDDRDDKELVSSLRVGGLVMVVRHGATFNDQAVRIHLTSTISPPSETSTTRARRWPPPSAALSVRSAFHRQGSYQQSNRAYETAVLAGFKGIEKTTDLTEGGPVVSRTKRATAQKPFARLGVAPQAGMSTILITHGPTSSTHSARTGSK